MEDSDRKNVWLKRLPTLILLIFATLVIIGIAYSRYTASIEESETKTTLYFFNTANNQWRTESFSIKSDEPKEKVSSILERLHNLPGQNVKAVPKETLTKVDINMDDFIIKVNFSENFNTLPLMDANICLVSIVYSLTSLDFAGSVWFFVEGEELSDIYGNPLGPINRTDIILENESLPNNMNTVQFKLYFVEAESQKLAIFEKSVETLPNKSTLTQALEELIKGPNDKKFLKIIPDDVKLRSDIAIEASICYIDFQSDFISRIENEELRMLIVYSIVNTVIDNSNATTKQVQFLFGGDKLSDTQQLQPDLSKPLDRNDSFVIPPSPRPTIAPTPEPTPTPKKNTGESTL